MLLFFDPDIENNEFQLNEEESYHCIKVLRLKEGSRIHVTNGMGNLFETSIKQVNKRTLKLEVIHKQSEFGKRLSHIHIAIAPTKNIDRFEWFLEKATEIGIDEITPIICDRSERTMIKPERQERVIVAAMKQSLKAYKPILNQTVSFKKFISQPLAENRKCIAICEADDRKPLQDACRKNEECCILIGPEGDFSPNEIQLAMQSGFIPVSLGDSRLRTETAGVVACHICNLVYPL